MCLTTCLLICQSPSSGFGDAAPGKEVSRGTLSVTIGRGSVIGKRVCQISRRKKTAKIEKGLETKHFPKNIDILA